MCWRRCRRRVATCVQLGSTAQCPPQHVLSVQLGPRQMASHVLHVQLVSTAATDSTVSCSAYAAGSTRTALGRIVLRVRPGLDNQCLISTGVWAAQRAGRAVQCTSRCVPNAPRGAETNLHGAVGATTYTVCSWHLCLGVNVSVPGMSCGFVTDTLRVVKALARRVTGKYSAQPVACVACTAGQYQGSAAS